MPVCLLLLLSLAHYLGHCTGGDALRQPGKPPRMHHGERSRGTTTHLFLPSHHLGSGASCEVFKGLQKETGRVHALKILKDAGWTHSLEHRREVEALQKLKHKNIVGFFGHELELGTNRTVLVVEYCNGGSLLTFLQEPHNHQGLRDDDLLVFLRDTSSGLQYLKEHRVVHRDLKPGNILRHVHADGKAIYKISDFGASRTLDQGEEEFMSLAGTEEYLHPELYKRAFVDRHSRQAFHGEGADLWSLGCTVYHACTAQIPFKPFGGSRSNRGTMYQMINQKPEGVISGVQLSMDSQIVWSKELPHQCSLSLDLRQPLQTLMAGLLAVGRGQWNFAAYLRAVQSVLAMRRYRLVDTETASVFSLYLSPRKGFADLQERVAMVTEIPATEQLLFSRSELPLPTSGPLPSPALPLVLVSRAQTQQGDYGSLKFNFEGYPVFALNQTLEEDLNIARQLCIFLERVRTRVVDVDCLLSHIPKAFSCIERHVQQTLERVARRGQLLLRTVEADRARMDLLKEQERVQADFTRSRSAELTSHLQQARKLVVELQRETQMIHEETRNTRKSLKDTQPLEDDSVSADSSEEDTRAGRLRTLVQNGREVLEKMKARKRQPGLSEMEKLEHINDKKYLQELCASAVHIWQSECETKLTRLHTDFMFKKSGLVARLEGLQVLEDSLTAAASRQEELADCLAAISSFLGRDWKEANKKMETLFKIAGESRSRDSLFRQHEEIRKRLEALLLDLPELELLPDIDVGGASVLNADRRKGRCRDDGRRT